MQPYIRFVFTAVSLQPGIAGQVADHPAGVHQIAGSCGLGMEPAAGDGGEAVVHALENIVADKAGAEAFRTVKLEVQSSGWGCLWGR